MAVINCVSAEYDSASQDLSNVASELQGAQINDFSEVVQSAMPGASRSVAAASSAESRFQSLLITHSKALYELASAAKAAGVTPRQWGIAEAWLSVVAQVVEPPKFLRSPEVWGEETKCLRGQKFNSGKLRHSRVMSKL